jgi:hypothetical protein
MSRETFATVWDPTPGENPVAHCCIRYADEGCYRNQTLSGAMYVSDLFEKCSCNVYDISGVVLVYELTEENILIRGGKLIRPAICVQ